MDQLAALTENEDHQSQHPHVGRKRRRLDSPEMGLSPEDEEPPTRERTMDIIPSTTLKTMVIHAVRCDSALLGHGGHSSETVYISISHGCFRVTVGRALCTAKWNSLVLSVSTWRLMMMSP